MNRKEYVFETIISNRLQLIKISSKSFRSPWVFRPSRYDVKIIWHGFNGLDQLLLLDSRATLTLYCLKTQKSLDKIQLNTEFKLTAYSDADRNRLFIYTDRSVGEGGRYEKYIYTLDTRKFKIVYNKTIELEYDCVDNSYEYHQISQYYKNKLYIAYQDEDIDDEVEDGYVIVNLQDKTIDKHLFDKTSYSYNFGNGCRIWFAPWFDLGLRPHYRNIKHTQSDGVECFTYAVDIFTLSTGEFLKTISLRDIQSKHIGYHGETQEKTALLRDADADSEDYREVHDAFFEDLNHVVWEKNEQAFWVLFRGGVLRRVDIQGNTSPLIVARDLRNNSREQDVLGQSYEHSYLLDIGENNNIKFGSVSRDYDSLIEFNPKNYTLTDESEVIDLPEGSVVDVINIQRYNYDALSTNIIEIEKWDLFNCIKALKQLYAMMQDDMDALVIDNWIKIYYKLSDEKIDDEEFYKRITVFGREIAVHLELVIELFIKSEKSESYYHDDETTFLLYGINTLIEIDKNYINLFIKYIANLDMDHDVNTSSLIYDVVKANTWTPLSVRLIFSCHTKIGSSDTYDMFSYFWEKEGLKEFVSDNYTASSLNELYNAIFNITNCLFDTDDVESRLEEFEGYSENSILIECFKNM